MAIFKLQVLTYLFVWWVGTKVTIPLLRNLLQVIQDLEHHLRLAPRHRPHQVVCLVVDQAPQVPACSGALLLQEHLDSHSQLDSVSFTINRVRTALEKPLNLTFLLKNP